MAKTWPRGRELAAKVVEHLEAHPGDFDQSNWETCVGGWACRLGGRTFIHEDTDMADYRLEPIDTDGESVLYQGPDGSFARVPYVAADLLGIDRYEASSWLWFATNEQALAYLKAYANDTI